MDELLDSVYHLTDLLDSLGWGILSGWNTQYEIYTSVFVGNKLLEQN